MTLFFVTSTMKIPIDITSMPNVRAVSRDVDFVGTILSYRNIIEIGTDRLSTEISVLAKNKLKKDDLCLKNILFCQELLLSNRVLLLVS